MALSRDDILGRSGLAIEEIQVPGWGGTVYIRELTGAERDAFELSCGDSLQNVRARLSALCLCDQDGKRLFEDAEVDQLGQLSGAALAVIFAAAKKLNALDDDDVKELEGN